MKKIMIGAMALALLGGTAAMAQPFDAGHDMHHDGGGQMDHRDGGDRRDDGDHHDGWRNHRGHIVCGWRHHHRVCHRAHW